MSSFLTSAQQEQSRGGEGPQGMVILSRSENWNSSSRGHTREDGRSGSWDLVKETRALHYLSSI